MTRRILLNVLLAFAFVASAMAQERSVTGTVTAEESGEPIPGVTVKVKGSTLGTATDIDGKYTLKIPEGNTVLNFSFIGLATEDVVVGNRSVVDMVMTADIKELESVVVTALGIERDERSIGYAAQSLDSKSFEQVRETNIVSSLSGKVAGVQINSNGNMGGSSRILVRGATSIYGNNQPLFVVDGIPLDNSNFNGADQARGGGGYDYGNAAQDINPDDIANMTVLKGAAAAALYGSRASNGVIVITTKSGKKKKGVGVSVNSGVTFESVLKLPKYQNEYGGGGSQKFGEYMGKPTPSYATDMSWGPKLDGQQVVQWYDLFAYEQGITNQLGTSPWVANPDNVKDFFETGVTFTNNVALSGANDNSNFRLSYTNKEISGVFPNSELSRHTLSFSASTQLNSKLKVAAKANYVGSEALGRPGTGYDGQNVFQQFNQWGQRQWSNEEHKNYMNPDGSQRGWNRISATDPRMKYSDNPYWVRHMNFQDDDRERFFGNVSLDYQILPELTATFKGMTDFYTDSRRERTAVGSTINDDAQGKGSYTEDIRRKKESNFEFILKYDKKFGQDLSLVTFAGLNRRLESYRRNRMETVNGLSVPGLYTLSNSNEKPLVTDDGYDKTVNSVFGSASVGYKDMLFLDATIRSDWSSSLPGQSFTYPSVTTSFVFSELPSLQDLPWLSFGKIRGGWAKVGNDTGAYRTTNVYTSREDGPFAAQPIFNFPNRSNNPDLRPEETTSVELGMDVRFLDNRLGLDVTYYSSNSVDQIIPVSISASTGGTGMWINAGSMKNHGLEVVLSATPLQLGDFRWDVAANYSRNRNELVDITGDLQTLRLGTAPFGVTVEAVKGEPYATIYGTAYERKDGQKLVNSGGKYTATSNKVALGSAMADWTGGITNTISYKGIRLNVVVDGSFGGEMFSTTNMWGRYSGIFEETASGDVRNKGIVAEGVMADGSKNTKNISAVAYHQSNNGYFIQEADIYDASYVKLREVSLSYSLPKTVTSKLGLNGVTMSIIGRNLAILHSDIPHIDPEYTTNSGNVQGVEGGATPSLRSYGFNLNFKF
ncbi:SusC/RagA family TonB-linked outer membrane protein [Fulvitalea axinellae]|uniref:SusC/RagA family TonB-linked outer membrane protein n=1 Tax=Fulvitalea axinellae TaxID=1182444 RepID=A0AAU9CUT5_9BACT|nr:SusC/RagA family TonB-linked outer membrane protein [Fulvitalea axinellae]